MNIEILNILSRHFPMLDDERLKHELALYTTLDEFEENTIITDVGNKIIKIPMVADGEVFVVRKSNSKDNLLYKLLPGDLCAMTTLASIQKKPTTVKLMAGKGCRLILASVDLTERWLIQYPTWKYFIMNSCEKLFDELIMLKENNKRIDNS